MARNYRPHAEGVNSPKTSSGCLVRETVKEGEDWHSVVYSPLKSNSLPSDWDEVKARIFKRDHYRCRACFKKRGVANLTCHHIIPRGDGVGNLADINLITLCLKCHDTIELNPKEYHSSEVIEGCMVRKYIPKTEADLNPKVATKWQQWVYGGYRNPSKH